LRGFWRTAIHAVNDALAATFVTYIWLRFWTARRELARIREYEFFTDKFFKASEILVPESDTPPGLLKVIEHVNSLIDQPREARQFFEVYGRFARARIEGKVSRQPDPELIAFNKKHPQLEPIVTGAMMGAVLALTFLECRRGTYHRAMLADLCGRERKPTIVMDAVNETKSGHGSMAAAAA
jgi:hypothetical protein